MHVSHAAEILVPADVLEQGHRFVAASAHLRNPLRELRRHLSSLLFEAQRAREDLTLPEVVDNLEISDALVREAERDAIDLFEETFGIPTRPRTREGILGREAAEHEVGATARPADTASGVPLLAALSATPLRPAQEASDVLRCEVRSELDGEGARVRVHDDARMPGVTRQARAARGKPEQRDEQDDSHASRAFTSLSSATRYPSAPRPSTKPTQAGRRTLSRRHSSRSLIFERWTSTTGLAKSRSAS